MADPSVYHGHSGADQGFSCEEEPAGLTLDLDRVVMAHLAILCLGWENGLLTRGGVHCRQARVASGLRRGKDGRPCAVGTYRWLA
jgi:hypothetical protein